MAKLSRTLRALWRESVFIERAVILVSLLAIVAFTVARYRLHQAPTSPFFTDVPAQESVPLPKITVTLTGAVTRPGRYTFKPDARTQDAVNAAGGFTPDADREALNLAAPLKNGSKIIVPRRKP